MYKNYYEWSMMNKMEEMVTFGDILLLIVSLQIMIFFLNCLGITCMMQAQN